MIGRLTGRIVQDDADGSLVFDVGGVGYEVVAPLGTAGRATPDATGATTLHIHTHVREDALVLFGFATREDRAVFRQLISVSNIGPKIALSILGSLGAAELASVVARSETARLVAIPGVGKKTAERIVLELKDKLALLPAPPAAARPEARVPAAALGDTSSLVLSALTRMGFRASEAERAVAALGSRVETDSLGDLVRDALASLAR